MQNKDIRKYFPFFLDKQVLLSSNNKKKKLLLLRVVSLESVNELQKTKCIVIAAYPVHH